MTIASKLVDLDNIKGEIRTAIIAKGVPVPVETPFREYDDKIALISGGGGGGDEDPPVVDWVRPSDWMAMPSMLITDQKIAILYLVPPKPITLVDQTLNFGGTGTVDIDWGDGSSDTAVSLASTVTHDLNYADLSGNPYIREEVFILELTTTNLSTTITSATPLLSGTIKPGMLVVGTGIPDHTTIVSENSATSWEISNAATASGTVNLELTEYYYRQALVVITPNTGDITHFVMETVTSGRPLNYALSFKASLPNYGTTEIRITTNSTFSPAGYLMKEIEFVSYGGTKFTYLCRYLKNLKKVVLPTSLSNVTHWNYAFANTESLEKIDTILDITGATGPSTHTLEGMFSAAKTLREFYFKNNVLPGGLSGCTNRSLMFQECENLRYLTFTIGGDNITDGGIGNSSQMFRSCRRLKEIPEISNGILVDNTGSSIGFFENCFSLEKFNNSELTIWQNALYVGRVYNYCYSLKNYPKTILKAESDKTLANFFSIATALDYIDSSNFVIDHSFNLYYFNGMFQSCTSLKYVIFPSISLRTSSITLNTFNFMFNSCLSLEEVHLPITNPDKIYNLSGMFQFCSNIKKITGVDWSQTSACINVSNMFNACHSLYDIPNVNMSGVTTSGNATSFANSKSVRRIRAFGMRFTWSLANLSLSREAIVEVFENLGTASGSQTLTYSGNPGTADITAADKLIATDKGWTLNPA